MKVFLFGAGASMHAGYPLCGQLGSRLVEWIETGEFQQTPGHDWIDSSEVRRLFPSLDDLEEIMSELRSPKANPGACQLAEANRLGMFCGLIEATCAYFDSIRQRNGAPLYQQFARQVLTPGDVIITFNYDVSLERELRGAGKWEIRDGYGFDLRIDSDDIVPSSPTKVLKLHGSTGWISRPFGLSGARSYGKFESLGPRPLIMPTEFEFLGYTSGVRDSWFTGGGMTRALSFIPPTQNKVFHAASQVHPRERKEFWGQLWGQAETALRMAEEITIVGYSLPVADQWARNLIFACGNCEAKITVYCGLDSNRLRDELAGQGLSIVDDGRSTFEEWLATKFSGEVD